MSSHHSSFSHPGNLETNQRYPQMQFNAAVREIIEHFKRDITHALDESAKRAEDINNAKIAKMRRDYEEQVERRLQENESTERIVSTLGAKVWISFPGPNITSFDISRTLEIISQKNCILRI
eukprot:TRINITY_DN3860_c0_g3_i4.p1 TRINITY_DN3860_c0_g3~~TRINITY_DN3860_c0_g3_i4.p1  ORF type:complete len:122 (+),score=16.64 TRINITY_DN3860_c0_g3_i4:82-447(+)